MEMATPIEMDERKGLDFPETGYNSYYSIIKQKLNELAKRKADIELVQKVKKGKRALTAEEQDCINEYDGVVAQLELTKNLLKTFYEENSKTEGTSTSINFPPTTSSFISPDPMDDQGNEILRLRKLLGEAEKREQDLINKIPSINTSINCVNVAQIMDILRALVPVMKDYKNELLLLGHIINGWILFLSAFSIILIVVLLFLNYDEANARPWKQHRTTFKLLPLASSHLIPWMTNVVKSYV